ncbi:hypothetical protein Tco_0828466 [Tanacetum coccineum]
MNCGATGFYDAVYWHNVTTYLRLPRRLNVRDRCRSLSPKSCLIYNHLQKIGNHMSEAFMILCITHTMPKEYSPYLFKFVGTCEEPMLMELYELVCKAEDNLRVKLDKIKKRKADEEVNDDWEMFRAHM